MTYLSYRKPDALTLPTIYVLQFFINWHFLNENAGILYVQNRKFNYMKIFQKIIGIEYEYGLRA